MASLRSLSVTYSISQLSRAFGVTPRALRFYEQQGLVTPDRVGDRRLYSRGDYQRLKVIVEARKAGLTLENARELLNLYDPADGGRAQLASAQAHLRERTAALEAELAFATQVLVKVEAKLAHLPADARAASQAEAASGSQSLQDRSAWAGSAAALPAR
jgi:DNA-binding transcriptional MerR regulator